MVKWALAWGEQMGWHFRALQAGAIFMVLLWMGMNFVTLGCNGKGANTSSELPLNPCASLITGQEYIVDIPNTDTMLLAIHETAWEQMAMAALELDGGKINDMLVSGHLLESPDRVRVKVIQRKLGLARIRILGGPQAGHTGWLKCAFLHRPLDKP